MSGITKKLPCGHSVTYELDYEERSDQTFFGPDEIPEPPCPQCAESVAALDAKNASIAADARIRHVEATNLVLQRKLARARATAKARADNEVRIDRLIGLIDKLISKEPT